MGDMFLTFAKKLGQPLPVQKIDSKDQKFDISLGKSQNLGSTLGRSPLNRSETIEESNAESQEVVETVRIDLTVIDNAFDKFYKTQESLGGFLNIKIIKSKDFP